MKHHRGGDETSPGGDETSPHIYIDNIEDKEYININNGEKLKNQFGFVPPKKEEVLEYAAQMNSMAGVGGFKCTEEQATEFFHHYAAQGWIAGNGIPIRDWKHKLRGWDKEKHHPCTIKRPDDDESRGI